ncbi:MAG: cobyrinate a,c-diamide synthase [Mailhella sp.]|nr:cobyrinate a,c-diamide synthase [Mailhella sp.]
MPEHGDNNGTIPALLVSGVSGSSGKTLVSLGLARALVRKGISVQPYKKGPDYIDSAWLSAACGRSCACLDPFFMNDDELKRHFRRYARGLCLIEGNRGFYDGSDIHGSSSTSRLAKLLDVPVVLVLSCSKMTRTAAALLFGMACFETGFNWAGVVLNRMGSARHAALTRKCIEEHTPFKVLGVLPRLRESPIPERHLGLSFSPCGSQQCLSALEKAADFIEENTDLTSHDFLNTIPGFSFPYSHEDAGQPSAVWDGGKNIGSSEPQICLSQELQPVSRHHGHAEQENSASVSSCVRNTAPESFRIAGCGNGMEALEISHDSGMTLQRESGPSIGFVYDDALWFYYRENLEALREAGAKLVRLSLLGDGQWPEGLDGLYLGGGYPELFAEALSKNGRLDAIRRYSEDGMPIYAECGGFMLLSASLDLEQDSIPGQETSSQPMTGVFPSEIVFTAKPVGLGYCEGTVIRTNPYFGLGTVIRGHEFHYSYMKPLAGKEDFVLSLRKGHGMCKEGNRRDGLIKNRTFASYMHIFAPSDPGWAENFVKACSDYIKEKERRQEQVRQCGTTTGLSQGS